MNKSRLIRLRELLEELQESNSKYELNMRVWYRPHSMDEPDCGTQCCALGLACLDSEFNKQGLILDYSGPKVVPTYLASSDNESFRFVGYTAADKFFELDSIQVGWIFDPSFYSCMETSDPSAVIQHITDVLYGKFTGKYLTKHVRW